MVLQFINVKVILYGITAMSSFVLPYYRGVSSVAAFVLLLSAVGFAGTLCWALFGAAFDRFFIKYSKIVNAVMALALVYCAGAMLLEV
jgi:threonine/homoserine/homoserine lactone efflux protein